MKIANVDLSEFSIRVNKESECMTHAAEELQRYLFKAFGTLLEIRKKAEGKQIVLDVGYDGKDDGFCVTCKDGNLYMTGESERGALYAAYDFLEKYAGWRFFSSRMRIDGAEAGSYIKPAEKRVEKVKGDIAEGESYEENPVILFRDMFGHASRDEDWCAKNRINADIWGLKNVTDELGGAEKFASMGGHSFAELLPSKKYFKDHPDWFSFVKGEWRGGDDYQICLTNPEVLEEVSKNAIAILDRNPRAKYVSVSQNDNENFCQCPRCVEAEKKVGRGNVLFDFVNRVADKIAAKHPKAKVHTYAYGSTIQDGMIPLRENVLIQHCLQYCRGHALGDESCQINARVAKILKETAKRCKNIFIYDYISCEAYIFQILPDFSRMRENMRFLADCNVKGIYAETDIFCSNSPCLEELRDYLQGKLMWNPYMSDEEFQTHTDEFLEGFYGAGWRHIKRYLEIWEEETKGTHYNSTRAVVMEDNGKTVRRADGKSQVCLLFPKEKIAEVCKALEKELDAAYEQANYEQKPRIDAIRVTPLWYRLFHTMDDVMANGTQEEKEKIVSENRELCSLMRRYCMKYTCFIGMTETTEMYKDFTLSPSKWKYWGWNSDFGAAFENIETV